MAADQVGWRSALVPSSGVGRNNCSIPGLGGRRDEESDEHESWEETKRGGSVVKKANNLLELDFQVRSDSRNIANRVGVSGLKSPGALRRLCSHLENRDCQLSAAIFDGSLTKPKIVETMIDACKKAGVVPIVSDPWDGGLASGVFTAANPSGGLALSSSKFSFQQLEKLQPLHSVLETVSERVRTRVIRTMRSTQDRFKGKYGPPPSINTDITTSQIALHWIIAKGGVPLPPVNNPGQADVVLGCLGWMLEDDEVTMLDNAAAFSKL